MTMITLQLTIEEARKLFRIINENDVYFEGDAPERAEMSDDLDSDEIHDVHSNLQYQLEVRGIRYKIYGHEGWCDASNTVEGGGAEFGEGDDDLFEDFSGEQI